jgi:hypothetical protein
MKRFPFLLLDAGPIIKLCELKMWDEFLRWYEVVIARSVIEDEVVFAGRGWDKEFIDQNMFVLNEQQALIKIVDADTKAIQEFRGQFQPEYRDRLDSGELETLTILSLDYPTGTVCAADAAVYRTLGLLGKQEQGISLEEALQQIGCNLKLEWKFTKKFREKFSKEGAADAIQGRGLKKPK